MRACVRVCVISDHCYLCMTVTLSLFSAVSLPPPPVLTGALTPNNWLSKAQRYADKSVAGPESMVVVNGE